MRAKLVEKFTRRFLWMMVLVDINRTSWVYKPTFTSLRGLTLESFIKDVAGQSFNSMDQ